MASVEVDPFDTTKWSTTGWQSRAVLRLIDAGNAAYCARCDELIKFRAKVKAYQVICNVYLDGRWDRVEHYHPECYQSSRSPYGPPAR
jgi:hypothetical protein